MQVNGVVVPGGPPVASLTVGHGEDPVRLLWGHGWHIIRALNAGVAPDDVVTLTFQVGKVRPGMKLPKRAARRRRGQRVQGSPAIKQRVACYAIVISSKGLLATRFARTTSASGTWGLPGGGREPGETPAETVLREIYEETGQVARIEKLLDLQSDHWVGRSPKGDLEDFHALRLIYAARCDEPTTPVVHDVGGTTGAAKWVNLRRWRGIAWSASTRYLLEQHLHSVIGE